MYLERELILYLQTYGNTKESDLLEYGTRISNQSKKNTKRLLNKMVIEGKAQRVVHNKLGRNIAYFTREGCCEHELAMQIETDSLDLKDKSKISEEAGRVLREAAEEAERRIQQKFPK